MYFRGGFAFQIHVGFLFLRAYSSPLPSCIIPYVVISVTAFELGAYLEYAKCSKLTGVCMASTSF